jgi:lipopolysaccharide transport system ATP-binding protein
MTPLLAVERLSKKYCASLRRALWYGVQDIAGEFLPVGSPGALRPGEFWALDDVSFELAPGESLAIIGDNGAGKSTLLKVLYGLLKPDRGEVRIGGQVEALIELGTGFNPLLTGRENIRVGAAVHGLGRRETDALLGSVAEFTELGDFLDAPLQSYSRGMKARLAYALATSFDPDLLLVDEVLAVGDAAFQRKCIAHMRGYLACGGSLLLVSHNVWQIQAVCARGILLDHGRVAFDGAAAKAVNEMLAGRLRRDAAAAAPQQATPSSSPVTIYDIRAEPLRGDSIVTGEAVRITLRYRAETALDVLWAFMISTADQLISVAGEIDLAGRRIEAGEGSLSCVIPRLPLVGGLYSLRGIILDRDSRVPFAYSPRLDALLEVHSSGRVVANSQMAESQLVTFDVDWS